MDGIFKGMVTCLNDHTTEERNKTTVHDSEDNKGHNTRTKTTFQN